MQDEITGDLAGLAGMKVIGSQSTRPYLPGKERNLHAIGRDLGVRHLLEGTVSRDHDQMRVVLQLVDLRDGGHPWTETYERPMKDVFALQSEITQAVAARLKARLSPNETVALDSPPTADLRAYDLYLRAQAIDVLVKDTAELASLAQQRISFLDQAVQRDPKFVLAYCALAKAYDDSIKPKTSRRWKSEMSIIARWLRPPWKRRGGFSPMLAQCISRSLIISFGRTTIFLRPVPR